VHLVTGCVRFLKCAQRVGVVGKEEAARIHSPVSCGSYVVVAHALSRATIPPHPPVDLQLSEQQRAPGKFTTLTQLRRAFPLDASLLFVAEYLRQ
jgi:hypothetical protein